MYLFIFNYIGVLGFMGKGALVIKEKTQVGAGSVACGNMEAGVLVAELEGLVELRLDRET